jgi:hypothetical protein
MSEVIEIKQFINGDAKQRHPKDVLENVMLTMYKDKNGEILISGFEPYPIEVVLNVFDVLRDNLIASIQKTANSLSGDKAEVERILKLSFALSYDENFKNATTFIDFLKKSVFNTFISKGLFTRVPYGEYYKDDITKMFYYNGSEPDVIIFDEKYKTQNDIATFFESEKSVNKGSGVIFVGCAADLADLFFKVNQMVIGNLKSRIHNQKFKDRLKAMREFDHKPSLLAFLAKYIKVKEKQEKAA